MKELEGCTFAPIIYTKKKKVKEPVQQQEGYDDEEPEEQPVRDINTFLEDQRRFDEERKMKQLQRQMIEEEELAAKQRSKMNPTSRKILEQKELR
jgi:uncharacterized Zn finger protein (UPF0148 family)